MSRKSSRSLVGLCSRFHVLPPSSLRRMVLPEPLAQTTRSLEALTPRRRAFTPDGCSVHDGAATTANRVSTKAIILMDLPGIADHAAGLHDELHAPGGGDVFRGISSDSHEIRLKSLRHPADLAFQVHHARVHRRG